MEEPSADIHSELPAFNLRLWYCLINGKILLLHYIKQQMIPQSRLKLLEGQCKLVEIIRREIWVLYIPRP